jgi:hypothetical protein
MMLDARTTGDSWHPGALLASHLLLRLRLHCQAAVPVAAATPLDTSAKNRDPVLTQVVCRLATGPRQGLLVG